MGQNVVQLLRERGLVADVTSPELEKLAGGTSLKIYCGFDPTADSLHLGNLLGILVLAWFQRCVSWLPPSIMGSDTAPLSRDVTRIAGHGTGESRRQEPRSMHQTASLPCNRHAETCSNLGVLPILPISVAEVLHARGCLLGLAAHCSQPARIVHLSPQVITPNAVGNLPHHAASDGVRDLPSRALAVGTHAPVRLTSLTLGPRCSLAMVGADCGGRLVAAPVRQRSGGGVIQD